MVSWQVLVTTRRLVSNFIECSLTALPLSPTMIPIQELLSRIRWDPAFGRGDFELGYYDRVEGRIIVVPFSEIDFSKDEPKVFRLVDAEDRTQRVPFHRVREVYKDGRLIWHRREGKTDG